MVRVVFWTASAWALPGARRAWPAATRPHQVCKRGCCRQSVSTQATRPLVAHNTWLRKGGADGPDSPFHQLNLAEGGLANAGGAIHHRKYDGLGMQDQKAVDWTHVFQNPSLPLVIDVGCGAGRFVLLAAFKGTIPANVIPLAQQSAPPSPAANFLGVDQHDTLMQRGNLWAAARRLESHCHYLPIDARVSLHTLLASYPGPVAVLAVQYPDPHYRRQRHVVTRDFVQSCAAALPPGACVLLASDVQSTARYMRDMFASHGQPTFQLHPLHHQPGATFPDDGGDTDPYVPPDTKRKYAQQTSSSDASSDEDGSDVLDSALCTDWAGSGWLSVNPLGVPTEREVFAQLVTKEPVFRVLLVRM